MNTFLPISINSTRSNRFTAGNTMVRAGSSEHYVAMREFIATHDMSQPATTTILKHRWIENFIDYWLARSTLPTPIVPISALAGKK